MLKKFSVEKPDLTRMKILEFCSQKCEFNYVCFELPLSNCCVKHKEITEYIKTVESLDLKQAKRLILSSERKTNAHSEENLNYNIDGKDKEEYFTSFDGD